MKTSCSSRRLNWSCRQCLFLAPLRRLPRYANNEPRFTVRIAVYSPKLRYLFDQTYKGCSKLGCFVSFTGIAFAGLVRLIIFGDVKRVSGNIYFLIPANELAPVFRALIRLHEYYCFCLPEAYFKLPAH